MLIPLSWMLQIVVTAVPIIATLGGAIYSRNAEARQWINGVAVFMSLPVSSLTIRSTIFTMFSW